jgi:hypothetical protein
MSVWPIIGRYIAEPAETLSTAERAGDMVIRDKALAVIAASVVARLLMVREAARGSVPLPGSIADDLHAARGAGHA